MRPTGVHFEGKWRHLFRIRGGKVMAIRNHCDTHALVQPCFGGDIPAGGLPSGQTVTLQSHRVQKKGKRNETLRSALRIANVCGFGAASAPPMGDVRRVKC